MTCQFLGFQHRNVWSALRARTRTLNPEKDESCNQWWWKYSNSIKQHIIQFRFIISDCSLIEATHRFILTTGSAIDQSLNNVRAAVSNTYHWTHPFTVNLCARASTNNAHSQWWWCPSCKQESAHSHEHERSRSQCVFVCRRRRWVRVEFECKVNGWCCVLCTIRKREKDKNNFQSPRESKPCTSPTALCSPVSWSAPAVDAPISCKDPFSVFDECVFVVTGSCTRNRHRQSRNSRSLCLSRSLVCPLCCEPANDILQQQRSTITTHALVCVCVAWCKWMRVCVLIYILAWVRVCERDIQRTKPKTHARRRWTSVSIFAPFRSHGRTRTRTGVKHSKCVSHTRARALIDKKMSCAVLFRQRTM